MIRRTILLGLVLTLVFASAGLCAEPEMLTFGGASFPKDSEYIDLGNIRVEDYALFESFLDQFPQLKKVDMFGTQIWRPRIEELAERYPQIEFGWTMRIGEHTVRTDQTAFSTLHNHNSEFHTEREFSVLKYCKNMVALDIGHNGVMDLSFLYDMPQLKVLIVACNLTLQDITPIGSLTELEYLELFKNDIRDISCLANCTKLIDLNICFNRIKDWTPLYGLKNLRRLWLYNSSNYSDIPIPKEVVTALRENLPDTKVDAVSYSTDGGWREHPRYDVIHEMFKTGVYIPFPEIVEGEVPPKEYDD